MYQPSAFRETRREVLDDLIGAYPFATPISQEAGEVSAEHLPLALVDGVLRGHVARGNPLARGEGRPVLAAFHGPDAYISPNWYPDKAATHREVPTWNYAVVQVHGVLRVIDDAAWLRGFLHEFTRRHEAGAPRPWSIEDAPEDYVQALLRAVVGIEIVPLRIEGKFKLGQNKSADTRRSVIDALTRRDRPRDPALAALTAHTLPAGA